MLKITNKMFDKLNEAIEESINNSLIDLYNLYSSGEFEDEKGRVSINIKVGINKTYNEVKRCDELEPIIAFMCKSKVPKESKLEGTLNTDGFVLDVGENDTDIILRKKIKSQMSLFEEVAICILNKKEQQMEKCERRNKETGCNKCIYYSKKEKSE